LLLVNEGKNLKSEDLYQFTFLQAQLNLIRNNKLAFEAATRELVTFFPNEMLTHYFAAIAAAQNEEWSKAESEILIAQKMGLPEEDVNSFLESGVGSKAATARYTKIFLNVLMIWGSGFVVLFIVGLILSTITLRALELEFSSGSGKKHSPVLRKIYKFLINFAGVYYYLSLPIILLLVLALVAGTFYLFLFIGRIPIQLMAVIGIGGLITAYSMIRALFTKTKYEDPGRELKEEEAPELFAMAREVAAKMNTRPIDEIRLTPEADLAVYERGSWKDKLGDKGKRILILGTGIIKDFKADDFRAVLAHEYGHFAHRDTAGGAVALQVRNDMYKTIFTLYGNGQTVWWNLAFQFIRLYDFIFRRISNGSTRLQEILADRVAAQHYGAPVFKNGLSYVIKRNIEFVKLAKVEIETARSANRPFYNLYELTTNSTSEIEEEFQKTLTRKTSRDDTHPSPVDRFRFIEGLGDGTIAAKNTYVRELFSNWDSITTEMTNKVEDGWKKAG
jgi:Zn-dependent protease with chaperone function